MKLTRPMETARLRVRSYRAEDRDFCLSLWGDRENGKYMSDPAAENADERYLSLFDGMEEDPDGYYLIAELRETGERVGTCCAFPENGNADIGYCIKKDRWRQGLGAEMVSALLLRAGEAGCVSATAEAADENAASVGLLLSLGFAPERKTVYRKLGEETRFEAHVYRKELANPE